MDSIDTPKLKFLCSYDGKILPRSSDGHLRYVGGHTRVLSVHPSITFSELMVKISEFCGSSMTLKCSLPNGDLETLISVTNDEDLSVIINLYERASSCNEEPSKIRAILSPIRASNKVSPSSSSANLSSSTESTRSSADSPPFSPSYKVPRPAVAFPLGVRYGSRKLCCCNSQLSRSSRFLIRGPSCLNFCQT